jgi:hypothetical protein
MSADEQTVLRAAIELTGSRPRLVEFQPLAERAGMDVIRVRAAAVALNGRRYCIMTFGGIQLTTAGMAAAGQA